MGVDSNQKNRDSMASRLSSEIVPREIRDSPSCPKI